MLEHDDHDLEFNQTLVEILVGCVSPEYIQQCVELNNILCRAGFTAQLEALDLLNAMVLADEIDNLSISLEIDALFRETLMVALRTCGVFFDEDIPFDRLIDLSRIILHFDVTETPQVLLDQVNSAEDDIDALCKTLAFLNHDDEDDWLPHIAEVGVGLIHRIQHLAQEQQSVLDNRTGLDTQLQYSMNERLLKIKAQGDSSVINNIDGLSATPSMESMYVLHLANLIDVPLEQAVDGVCSISFTCAPSFEAAVQGVNTLLDDLYDTPNERMEAEGMKQKYIQKYAPIFSETPLC